MSVVVTLALDRCLRCRRCHEGSLACDGLFGCVVVVVVDVGSCGNIGRGWMLFGCGCRFSVVLSRSAVQMFRIRDCCNCVVDL